MEALVPGSDLFNSYLFSLSPGEIGDFVKDFWLGVELELEQAGLQLDLIGEIGLDYYWLSKMESIQDDLSATYDSIEEVVQRSKSLQQELLDSQLDYASRKQLPVSLHSRGAEQEVIAAVKDSKNRSKYSRGIFHSFTGTLEQLTEIQALEGFLVGINGIVTYKSARELLTAIKSKLQLSGELDIAGLYKQGFVLETDAPYLIPSNAKRQELEKDKTGRHINEPSCVKSILDFLGK
jgi:TatD DNase family protein